MSRLKLLPYRDLAIVAEAAGLVGSVPWKSQYIPIPGWPYHRHSRSRQAGDSPPAAAQDHSRHGIDGGRVQPFGGLTVVLPAAQPVSGRDPVIHGVAHGVAH